MPFKTGIRPPGAAQNPANDFSARLLELPAATTCFVIAGIPTAVAPTVASQFTGFPNTCLVARGEDILDPKSSSLATLPMLGRPTLRVVGLPNVVDPSALAAQGVTVYVLIVAKEPVQQITQRC